MSGQLRIRQIPTLMCADCGQHLTLVFTVHNGNMLDPDLNNVLVRHTCKVTGVNMDTIVPVDRLTSGIVEVS